MKAFNVVRFRVKPGSEQRFIDAQRDFRRGFKGFLGGTLIRTGEQTFCLVGEWQSMKRLAAARPEMIAFLDQLRDMLEDLGGGLGVTDPVSGEAVARLRAGAKAAKKRPAPAGRKTAAKRPAARRARKAKKR